MKGCETFDFRGVKESEGISGKKIGSDFEDSRKPGGGVFDSLPIGTQLVLYDYAI